jgi:exodeoxyribonuclease VII large subunit
VTRRGRAPTPGDLFGEPREPARPAPAGGPRAASRRAYTVTELASILKGAAERETGQVWIKGEVIGLKVYEAGHWYFMLSDEESQLRCVMWRTYARRQRVTPPEGTEVYVLATPTVWTPKGELRLSAVTMLPTAGIGLQQLSFERTREVLEREGLLDPARKRRLPPFPRAIAVVTSPDGAVLHDIVTVTRARWPSARVILIPARVQGDDAVDELVAALELVNRVPGIDVCIVARGGGSRDDLFAFNAEPVCRAVAGVRAPTISAVGHETDVTLTDLVADRRAATPSAAAAMALPDRADVARYASSLAIRLANGLTRRTEVVEQRLARMMERAKSTVERTLAERRGRLERLAAGLDALSPLAVLHRGYSIARLESGVVARSVGQLPPGTAFRLRLSDGEIPSEVRERLP